MKKTIKILKNKSLKEFTSFKIGGKAKYFASVSKPEELLSLLKYANKINIPVYVFGGGPNVVFGDGVLNYLFIRFYGGKIIKKENFLIVDAGVPLYKVIDFALKRGLSGLEKLTDIPGTIGGAIYGNAGAFGVSISDVVEEVEIWDNVKNKTMWVGKKFCKFKYRESIFKNNSRYYILRVKLKLKNGNKKYIKKISDEIKKIRRRKYEPTLKCPGSFFKNVLVKDINPRVLNKIDSSKIIEGKIPAGYLLEEVGVKGKDFGSLKIADFHANIIINKGKATFNDVKKLSAFLKKQVKDKFGVLLEEEIVFVE
jgi:UDP-N-acetylmuramate dehydrogenase